jgi:predicted nucleic acid-binding Zn ribbon protein
MSRKGNIWTACRIKKFHSNFWSAIQHCISLQKEDPSAPIYVYKCGHCTGMHVTRGLSDSNRAMSVVKKALKKNLKMMSSINFWMKADPVHVASKIDSEIRLLKHLLGIELIPRNHWMYEDWNTGEYSDETTLPDWDD